MATQWMSVSISMGLRTVVLQRAGVTYLRTPLDGGWSVDAAPRTFSPPAAAWSLLPGVHVSAYSTLIRSSWLLVIALAGILVALTWRVTRIRHRSQAFAVEPPRTQVVS